MPLTISSSTAIFGNMAKACWHKLNPQVTEKILDLGCGTGQLAGQISASGAEVIGIDSDPNNDCSSSG